MTVAKTPIRQSLPYVIAGLVVIGVAVFLLWLVSGVAGARASASTGTSEQATVLTSVVCSSANPYETVTAQVGGHPMQLKFNGCGDGAGTKLTVLVPAGTTPGSVIYLAQAAPGNASGLSHRVAFLLLVVAAAAGGGFGYLLHRQRTEPAADGARPAADRSADRRWGGGRHTGTQPKIGVTEEEESSPVANDDPNGTNWFEDSAINPPLDPEQAVDHADKS